jgi:hypothetical protein
MHFDARATNAPMQVFSADVRRLQGQIIGDPDFDLLRVTAGGDFGLPSPGIAVLQDLGATYNVYNHFDITYRIDFIGRPGGPFGGMSGSTTGTARFVLGDPNVPEPAAAALLAAAIVAIAPHFRRRSSTTKSL